MKTETAKALTQVLTHTFEALSTDVTVEVAQETEAGEPGIAFIAPVKGRVELDEVSDVGAVAAAFIGGTWS